MLDEIKRCNLNRVEIVGGSIEGSIGGRFCRDEGGFRGIIGDFGSCFCGPSLARKKKSRKLSSVARVGMGMT